MTRIEQLLFAGGALCLAHYDLRLAGLYLVAMAWGCRLEAARDKARHGAAKQEAAR